MPRKYSASGTQTVTSPTDTALGVVSATTIRPEVFYLTFGTTATPSDAALQWITQRITAAGTNTSVTPTALDPGDPASLATAGSNHTAEPTYTAGAILLDVALNARGTFQWTARQGCELKMPATAANGFGVQPVHASYTGDVLVHAHWFE